MGIMIQYKNKLACVVLFLFFAARRTAAFVLLKGCETVTLAAQEQLDADTPRGCSTHTCSTQDTCSCTESASGVVATCLDGCQYTHSSSGLTVTRSFTAGQSVSGGRTYAAFMTTVRAVYGAVGKYSYFVVPGEFACAADFGDTDCFCELYYCDAAQQQVGSRVDCSHVLGGISFTTCAPPNLDAVPASSPLMLRMLAAVDQGCINDQDTASTGSTPTENNNNSPSGSAPSQPNGTPSTPSGNDQDTSSRGSTPTDNNDNNPSGSVPSQPNDTPSTPVSPSNSASVSPRTLLWTWDVLAFFGMGFWLIFVY